MPAIRTAPVPLPGDVVDYISHTFQAANRAAATRLDRMPTTHEENLDMALIEAIDTASGPHITPSGVVVDVEIHFVGGGRHYRRWEVADIGLILNFRRSGSLIRTKVVLLQSKRLYPNESEFVEFRGLARTGGFGSLMQPSWVLPAQEPRMYNFTEDCRYKAMKVGDEQWVAIEAYEQQHAIPVHYLLYHPSEIPHSREIPTQLPFVSSTASPTVGSRVLAATEIRAATSAMAPNLAPSFADLRAGTALPGQALEDFITTEVLTCKQGYIAQPGVADAGLNAVFYQRTGPISAAIRFDIDVPEDLVLPEQDEVDG